MTSWFRRRDRDDELGEEIRAHLEMAVRDRVERGEPRAQAEAAARREIGNVATIQEVTREMWGRHVARAAGAGPALRPAAPPPESGVHGGRRPVARARHRREHRHLPGHQRGPPAHAAGAQSRTSIAEIRLVDPAGMRGSFNSWNPTLTNPIWEQIRARQQGFSSLLATGAATFNLATGGESRPRRASGSAAGSSTSLGVRPAAGRVLTDADDRRGCPARAVLSYPFWQREYGGDRSVVGRTIDAPGAAGRNRRRRAGGILRARGRPIVRRGAADLRPADPRRRRQHPRLRHQLVADGHGPAQARVVPPAGDRAARHHLSRPVSARRSRRTTRPSAFRSTSTSSSRPTAPASGISALREQLRGAALAAARHGRARPA